MTDILFLELVNSRMFKSLYLSSLPLIVIIRLFSSSRLMNEAPKNLAAFTSESSSGDDALNLPVLSSITIVWHRARCMRTCSILLKLL